MQYFIRVIGVTSCTVSNDLLCFLVCSFLYLSGVTVSNIKRKLDLKEEFCPPEFTGNQQYQIYTSIINITLWFISIFSIFIEDSNLQSLLLQSDQDQFLLRILSGNLFLFKLCLQKAFGISLSAITHLTCTISQLSTFLLQGKRIV